jgi:ABC-type uncharacterized transport system permease subunit
MRRRIAAAGIEITLSAAVCVAALGVAMLIVAASGSPAGTTISTFFSGAFGDNIAIGATIEKMVPLVLVALGWILVFSGGRFHVGFPGQILMGGLLTTIVSLQLAGLPLAIGLPLGAAAGVLGGMAYAALVAWLWSRRGVNEILSTLLLNLIAVQILAWAVRGPVQQSAHVLPQSNPLPDSTIWPAVAGYPLLHWDFVLIPIAVILVSFLLRRTPFGFRLRLVGGNETAARYAGASPHRIGVVAIVLSGALAGLAGSALIQAGDTRSLTENFDAGYGFQGIAVALLARNSPLGCIPAALLFAALRQGGGVVQAEVGVSSALVDITQGLVICFVIGAAGLLYVLRQRASWQQGRPRRSRPAGGATPRALDAA